MVQLSLRTPNEILLTSSVKESVAIKDGKSAFAKYNRVDPFETSTNDLYTNSYTKIETWWVYFASSTIQLTYGLTKLFSRGMDAENTVAEKEQRAIKETQGLKISQQLAFQSRSSNRYYSKFLTYCLIAEESHSGTV